MRALPTAPSCHRRSGSDTACWSGWFAAVFGLRGRNYRNISRLQNWPDRQYRCLSFCGKLIAKQLPAATRGSVFNPSTEHCPNPHRTCNDLFGSMPMHIEETEQSIAIRDIVVGDAEVDSRRTEQLGYDRTPEEIREWIAGLDSVRGRQVALVACIAAEIVGWIEVSIERRLQSPV